VRQHAAQRVGDPAVAEQRRIHPVRERAQLLERELDLVAELVDRLQGRDRIDAPELLGERELDPQADQALLSAVVQVALDARALDVGAAGDPLARHVELGHHTFVLDGGEDERADGGEQLLFVRDRAVVHERRDGRIADVDRREHPAVAPRRRR
jgi:hypothetical protein